MAKRWQIWGAGTIAITGLVLWGLQRWQHQILPPADRVLPSALVLKERPFRITLVGTSLTSRPGWPDALERPLERCLGVDVIVTRVARAGMNSRWGRAQLQAIQQTNPDLVAIEFSGNDADLHNGVSLSESEANHRHLIEGLRSSHSDLPVILMVMSPKYGLPSLMRPLLPRYTAIYSSLSGQLDTGLLDFYPRWLVRPWQDRGLQNDGQHPDPVVANEVIVPVIVAYIGQAADKPCKE